MSSANPSQNASQGNLSAVEAAELAYGIAELTKSGLPLPEGLRALAEEWPTRRLRFVLNLLADRVEQGVALDEAINQIGSRLPVYLRGLITAGIRSGRLAEVMEEYIDIERSQHELRRQVWLALIYPTILMIAITILAGILTLFIVHPIGRILKDFGTDIPAITYILIHYSGFITLLLLCLTVLIITIPVLLVKWPGNKWLSPMLYRVPFIGSLLKWNEMARFSRFMSIFLEQQVPAADALRLTACGLCDGYLARSCRQAAMDIERGRSFSDCIGSRRRFPADLVPLIVVGERSSKLGGALHAATEMFEGRTNTQSRYIEGLFLPAAYFLIAFFCGFVLIGIYMPLISLITRLTGGH
jgi:type II secretory pathway component PulF